MPAVDNCVNCCCVKATNKEGTVAIGVTLLIFSIVLTGVSVGFISGWESFDTSFLVDTSNRIRAECDKEELHGNCTGPLWVAGRVDHLQERLGNLSSTLKEIGPVWKNEFISLFCFMPWYALINLLLIIGAVKEIRGLLLVWLVATVIALVWEFVLLSILFSFDTTVGFVLTLSVLHLFNFVLLSYFILVVFSYYQELTAKTIKHLINGRSDEYRAKVEQD